MSASFRTACKGVVVVLALTGPVSAQPNPEEIDPAAGVEQLTEGEARVVTRISRQLETPVEDLLRLRARGMGWGDVEMALLVARHAGEPVENVVGLWSDHGGAWQPVGDELGIADVEALKAEFREDD